MASYSIKDLERLSGIKAHTIRIWEQRYKLLTPSRSETNIRSYDDDQVKKLLNVVTLLEAGTKISHISKLSPQEIGQRVTELHESINESDNGYYPYINGMISAALNYDNPGFDNQMNEAVNKYGFEKTFEQVVYPVLRKVGLLWRKDEINPAQEHFLSNLVKHKLHSQIENLPAVEKPQDTFLLFLPQWEDHEIGLLYTYYFLKKNKQRVIYLGAKVPLVNLQEAIENVSPDYLITFLIGTISKEAAADYLTEIKVPSSLYLAGVPSIISQFDFIKANNILHSIEDFKSKFNFV